MKDTFNQNEEDLLEVIDRFVKYCEEYNKKQNVVLSEKQYGIFKTLCYRAEKKGIDRNNRVLDLDVEKETGKLESEILSLLREKAKTVYQAGKNANAEEIKQLHQTFRTIAKELKEARSNTNDTRTPEEQKALIKDLHQQRRDARKRLSALEKNTQNRVMRTFENSEFLQIKFILFTK